jgi:hypothetical protein
MVPHQPPPFMEIAVAPRPPRPVVVKALQPTTQEVAETLRPITHLALMKVM